MGTMNRRAVLGAFPALAATGTLAAAASAPPADPIFAAVMEMKAASEKHHAIWDEADETPAVRRDPVWIARRDAAFRHWELMAMAMAAVVPTTPAGLVALLELLQEDIGAGDSIWQIDALHSAVSAARRLAGEA